MKFKVTDTDMFVEIAAWFNNFSPLRARHLQVDKMDQTKTNLPCIHSLWL